MKSLKLKMSLIVALAVAFIAALCVSFGLFAANADRSVTISGSSVFYTAGGAEIWAHKETETDDSEYFSMFVLKDDGDAVNYRKNLAYNWFVADITDVGEDPAVFGEKKNGRFNMEIGFENLNFKKVIITFEGQQFSQTKDGKSVNYVVFAPAESENDVKVMITDDKEAEFPSNAGTVKKDHIKIEFTDRVNDEYKVSVFNTGGTPVTGEFKNVGGNYAKYSSSSTTPVTPLSFKAEFDKNDADVAEGTAHVIMYKLNGQAFRLGTFRKTSDATAENFKDFYVKDGNDYVKVASDASFDSDTEYFNYVAGVSQSGTHYTGGTVNDTTPPVLCLDNGVSYIEEGKEISFKYTVIDVLASSPSVTTSYFMLTDKQAENEFNSEDYKNKSLFREVEDSDDQFMLPHVEHYIPTANDVENKAFGQDFTATAVVKVMLKLTDTTSTGGLSTYALMDWYVEDKYLIDINNSSYIAVAKDERGASFAYNDDETKTSDVASEAWTNKLNEYQNKVTEAAAELKAGSKNYFYLPSVESLLNDNATAYTDMSFGIYYKTDSSSSDGGQSVTGKASNALSINLTSAGKYIFTVYATDGSGNKMYYYKDNELVEFETSEIWTMYNDKDDEGLKDYLPWFEFEVKASEISIEDPGERDTAYVGTEYTGISFDINGVNYKAEYELYLFNNDLYYESNNNTALTYDEFMAQKEQLLKEHREWFTHIPAKNDSVMVDGSEEEEEFGKYAWDNSSLRFTPQDDNAFYLVKCTVTSNDNGKQQDVAYMGISASPKVRELVGEDTWLQDNMTSVILLCIAGASLIGIILLLVIKPKEKVDVEEVYETGKRK